MRSTIIAALWCVAVGVSLPCYASTQDKLKATEYEIEQSEQKQRQLVKEQAKLARELQVLQRQLVRAARDIQTNEQALSDAIIQLAATKQELAQKEKHITKNKGRLEALVAVALRFSRMPPEAMVMMPDDTDQTLRVSKALAMLSKDIKQETKNLAEQKYELEQLQTVLKKQKTNKEQQQTRLEAKRKELETKLKERKRLQAGLRHDLDKETQRAEKLAGQAKNLQNLLSDLASQRTIEADKSDAPPHVRRGKLRSFADAKGRIRLPVTGVLKERYGKENHAGSAHKGVTIATPSRAQVIAPYDGEVLFAGKFLNYGRMAIIRHSDDFHTLLAGLGRLDIQTGEFLLEGEPIGAMGSSKYQRNLYVELRKKNQPINPSTWIKGLK